MNNTNKIAVFLDLENIVRCFGEIQSLPTRFSLADGFDEMLDWLKKIGEVICFCVFIPSYFIYRGTITQQDLEYFQKRKFFTILCPKMGFPGKRETKDTTDENLLRWGLRFVLPHISGITHICIGSGDVDFLELYTEAEARGLKILITVGSQQIQRSLSREVEKRADLCPKTHKPLIHIFDPKREQ